MVKLNRPSVKAGAAKRQRDNRVGKVATRTRANRTQALSNARQIPRAPSSVASVMASQKRGCDYEWDIGISGGIVNTTNDNSDFICVNMVQEGPGNHNRVGRMIFMKSLRLKGLIRATVQPNTETPKICRYPYLRVVVIYDRQPTGTFPTWDTVFGCTLNTGAEECDNIATPPRYDNMQRFSLLADDSVEFQDVQPLGDGAAIAEIPYDKFIPLKNLETSFKSTTNPAALGDISSGALYVAVRASSRLAQYSIIQTYGYARLRFY